MVTTQLALRMLTLLLLALIVVLCTVAWWQRPRLRVLTVPPLTWSLHGLGFYAAVLWLDLAPRMVYLWLAVLWLHTCFLVTAGVWLFLWPGRVKS